MPEGLHPVGRDPTLEQGKSVMSPAPEEDEAAETTCDELTPTPLPVPLHRWWRVGREFGSEAVPGKKGGVGERCFKIWFYFSLPYSGSIGNKLIFLKSSLVCPWQ